MTTEVSGRKSAEDDRTNPYRAFQHHALLYRGEQEFLDGALPLLRAGIEADDPTFAVTAGRHTELLRDSLGQDAAAVQFLDPAEIYKNPVRALAAFTAVAKTLGPRPAWVVMAEDWSTHPDVMEWLRYDSIVNLAFAHVDIHGFCCYDRATLAPDVLDLLRRTHVKIHEGGALRDNPFFADPESVVADIDRRPLPPPAEPPASMQILPTDLHAVRTFVAEQAKRCGVTAEALHNLLVAVTEVATNAVRHGNAPATLRTWPDNGLICEITDSGHWQPEEFISWRPPESARESGFGLWGVGMLCDTVQVRTGSNGTTVRLRTCA
ncbi:anti-sigma factor RsbA family regulatory protein [Streptomyces sp. 8N706]|uniref:anti-sigma factor RsbA family regulatory protein n=1 Tax=Streptomyces sp. 8N706 TaxID=3457416 RepID=UPI003FD11867